MLGWQQQGSALAGLEVVAGLQQVAEARLHACRENEGLAGGACWGPVVRPALVLQTEPPAAAWPAVRLRSAVPLVDVAVAAALTCGCPGTRAGHWVAAHLAWGGRLLPVRCEPEAKHHGDGACCVAWVT